MYEVCSSLLKKDVFQCCLRAYWCWLGFSMPLLSSKRAYKVSQRGELAIFCFAIFCFSFKEMRFCINVFGVFLVV